MGWLFFSFYAANIILIAKPQRDLTKTSRDQRPSETQTQKYQTKYLLQNSIINKRSYTLTKQVHSKNASPVQNSINVNSIN